MHISTKFCAFVAAATLAVAGATAAPTAPAGRVDLTKFVCKAKTHNALQSDRSLKVASANAKMMRGEAPRFKATAEDPYQAGKSFGPTNMWSDLDGPNGELWFYSLVYDYEHVVMNEYWTDHIIKGFELTIYDSEYKVVSTIKDEIRYTEDEKRAVYADILPVLTQHFFNNDDKYEIIMGLGINTTTPGFNHYKSLIYQLDGETDADGNAKVVYEVPNLVSDVLNASADGKEQYYLTLMDEYFPDVDYDDIFGDESWTGGNDGDEEKEPNYAYWEYLNSSFIEMTTFSGVDAEGNLIPVLSHKIAYQNLPGDQENVAFTLTLMNGNQPMIMFQQYKETFFYPYYSYTDELVQRDENSLEVKLYNLYPDKAELFQTTEIPFVLDRVNVAQFFSVGSFSYRGDINFTDYNTDGKAALIVTRQDKDSMDTEGGYPTTYIVYNPDGSKKLTLAENTVASIMMSDIPGFAPQCMFATYNGVYYFHFVNILTGEEESVFSYLLEIDGDNDPVTSNMDRVAYGDSYAYVGELRAPLDEDDVTYMRIVWIDRQGEPLFVDELNMGEAVHYGQSYISQTTLAPDVFHSDAKREYMLLIKRGKEDGGNAEELLIAQPRDEDNPEGNPILLLGADDRGALSNIAPYMELGVPQLVISYYSRNNGTDEYCVDVYDLPFDNPLQGGVSTPEAVTNANITFNGAEVFAAGEYIEIFNLQGILVKAGNESVSTASLPAGAYIAKASEGALKFIKK